MKSKKAAIKGLIVLSVAVFLVFSGCGKKGRPLAPLIKGQKLAAPFDLKYTPGDKAVLLSWNHQIDVETAAVTPRDFEVFMAQKTINACEGCPFEFKMIGAVPMPSMTFAAPIEKGVKYYFRVQATGEDNMRSAYSKTVQFESK